MRELGQIIGVILLVTFVILAFGAGPSFVRWVNHRLTIQASVCPPLADPPAKP